MDNATAFTPQELLQIRKQFPILATKVASGASLVYLDWAATAQKPKQVLDCEYEFYCKYNGAIDRGTHYLVGQATSKFEQARQTVANFFGAHAEEIVWTKNATEAINLVSYAFNNSTFNQANFKAPCFQLDSNSEICITLAEHHANIIPWQQLCQRTGAKLIFLDLLSDGSIDLANLTKINPNTKLVAITHLSNVTGIVSPVAAIVAKARQVKALVLLDSCQSAAHQAINVKQLDVDFAVFSAHKMFAPTGIGALYAKQELLEQMPPVLTGGGSMVKQVTEQTTDFQTGYMRLEAGTQPVSQAIAWAQAIEFINSIGISRIAKREQQLTNYLLEILSQIPHLHILGSTKDNQKTSIVSFSLDGIHPHDVGQVLDAYGVALRVGHHCAMPLHKFFGVKSSTRASLSFVNLETELDTLAEALIKVTDFFK